VEAAIDACHLRYAPSLASASDTSEDTSNACASADVPSPPPSPSLEFRVVNRSDKALPFPRELMIEISFPANLTALFDE